MFGGKKLFSFIDVDENTPIQKLSVMDQIRVLLKKIMADDAAELAADNAVTISMLKLKADLMAILDDALAPIRKGQNFAVSIQIPNEFDPVLDEVLNSPRIKNYYTATIDRPDIDYDIPYNLRLNLEVKP